MIIKSYEYFEFIMDPSIWFVFPTIGITKEGVAIMWLCFAAAINWRLN